jgi:poly(beta-D-mannuronate) lyase
MFLSPRPVLLVVSLLCATASNGRAADYRVDSVAALAERLAAAQPGDTLIVAAGSYVTEAPLVVACAGTAEKPLTIRAERVGEAEIKGKHGFEVAKGAAHVVIEGFRFTHAAGSTRVPPGAHHVRFTRNVFQCAGEGAYLTVSGDDVEVDRNEFRDKRTLGNMLSVTGAEGQVARRLRVHHNHFHDFAPAGGNGAETIRLGLSGLSMSMGGAVVEHNLFERCVGENELISNKSGGNTYRYNTFLDSPGAQLTLRHGNECVVYGNLFHGTDGLRIFGDRHRIHSNHFEGNTLGITLGNGGAEVADGAPLTSHDRPDDCFIVFNTLVDNRVHYRMTRRTPTALGAKRTTFACNIIVGGEAVARIEGPNEGAVWSDNLVWKATELGDLPASGARVVDVRLTPGPDGSHRLAAGSPAIDAGDGQFPWVDVDRDGQPRTGRKDLGADENSAAPIVARRLTPADVGPASGR